jgi:hypothetical protein
VAGLSGGLRLYNRCKVIVTYGVDILERIQTTNFLASHNSVDISVVIQYSAHMHHFICTAHIKSKECDLSMLC